MSETARDVQPRPEELPSAEAPARGTQVERRDRTPSPVPERPRLAPNIVLSGEMEDSAFEQQPWLVQRDGHFVQLTELLYRVAEQIDGRRSLDDIATGVSEAINRDVTADNVRQLIERKLIPQGIVAGADGSVVSAGESGRQGPRSALQINMRVKMLGPGWIDPFTRVLKGLYWPPVLLAVLAVCVATQVWLYFVHGIAGGVRDAIYHPGLLIALLGIIIVSTLFHEFGHASALRYGGGQVRGIGMGLYLVYPAFYTDVSENYRLGRWARVRTDLGGFYFNLIFAAVMVGLYFATHQSFLLLVVLLTDLEIVHQCLPFVRLDGYWTLADITGLPDFFSQMGPFVRSVIPWLPQKGTKLPALKTWVKVVFGIYTVVTVPVLAFVLFIMVKAAPHVLATAWASGTGLYDAFSRARAHGQTLTMVSAGVQMAILALPAAGLVYTFTRLGRQIFGALWRWGRHSAAHRAASLLGMGGVIALLTYLWLPQIPFAPKGASGPLYAVSGWTPISPRETGTFRDAVPVIAGVRTPGNRSPAQSTRPTPTPRTQAKPTPTAHARPAAVATTTPTTITTSTPAPQSTVVPTAVQTALPTTAPTVVATSVPAVPPPPTVVPTTVATSAP